VLPVACSFDAERKEVFSAAPLNFTTAPDWNPVPLTVRVKLPMRNGLGVMEVIVGAGTGGGGGGVGAWMVTAAVPVEPGVPALVACMVTVAGLGTVAGAV
jgi:hypothetical protein